MNAGGEKDFVDLRFEFGGETYIGEIKVTTTLRLEEAFRTALGMLFVNLACAQPKAPYAKVPFGNLTQETTTYVAYFVSWFGGRR